jgi:mRNA interferase RelE/StbE
LKQYSVILMPQAQKDPDGFSGKFLSKLEHIILGLYDEPRPYNSKKLSGGGSTWRIRMGTHRILYEIDDAKNLVKVYRIAHRKEVYR